MANYNLPVNTVDSTPDPTVHAALHNRANGAVNDLDSRVSANSATLTQHENRIYKLETLTPGATPGGTPAGGGTTTTGTGPAGASGTSVRNGTGAPADNVGVDGEFYIDTASAGYTMYGPKGTPTAGSWTGSATKDLRGPAGASAPGAQTTPTGIAYAITRPPYPLKGSQYAQFNRSLVIPLTTDPQNLLGLGPDAVVGNAYAGSGTTLAYYLTGSGRNGTVAGPPGTNVAGFALSGDLPVMLTSGNTPGADKVVYEYSANRWNAVSYTNKGAAMTVSTNGNVNGDTESGSVLVGFGSTYHLIDARGGAAGSADFRLAYRNLGSAAYTLGAFGLQNALPYASGDLALGQGSYSMDLIGSGGGYLWAHVNYGSGAGGTLSGTTYPSHSAGDVWLVKPSDSTTPWAVASTTLGVAGTRAFRVAADGALWVMEIVPPNSTTQQFTRLTPGGAASNPFLAADPFPTTGPDVPGQSTTDFVLIPGTTSTVPVQYVVTISASSSGTGSHALLVYYILNPNTGSVATVDSFDSGPVSTGGLYTYRVVLGAKGSDGKTQILSTFQPLGPTPVDNDRLDSIFVA